MEVVASLSQGRTAAAQCGLFTYKSVPVIFEPPCSFGARIYFPVDIVKLRWNCITDSVSLPNCGGLGLHTDRRNVASRTILNVTDELFLCQSSSLCSRTDQIHLLTAITTYFLKLILIIRSSPWLFKKPSALLNVSSFKLFAQFLIPYRRFIFNRIYLRDKKCLSSFYKIVPACVRERERGGRRERERERRVAIEAGRASVKVKVKFTLEQATEVRMGSRYIALPFL